MQSLQLLQGHERSSVFIHTQEREHTVHDRDKTMAERCRMEEREENI